MPPPDDRGRDVEYLRSAFIEAIEAESGLASTTDVADHVDCSYELAYKRLQELADEGRVESKRIGNSHAWTVTDA